MARKKAVKKELSNESSKEDDKFADTKVDTKILEEMSQEPKTFSKKKLKLESYIVHTYFKGHASRKDFHNVIVGETLELTVDQAKAFAAYIKEA